MKLRRALPLAVLGFAVLAGLAAPAGAGEELSLDDPFATVGRVKAVRLTGAADPAALRLRVVYRPNSATAVTRMLGAFTGAGTFDWIPEVPGLTVLEAVRPDGRDEAGEERFATVTRIRVATCYAATPVGGLVVMILAGTLLFGGAGVSLWLALRETPDADRPSR